MAVKLDDSSSSLVRGPFVRRKLDGYLKVTFGMDVASEMLRDVDSSVSS
jgi:hypothetical protein